MMKHCFGMPKLQAKRESVSSGHDGLFPSRDSISKTTSDRATSGVYRAPCIGADSDAWPTGPRCPRAVSHFLLTGNAPLRGPCSQHAAVLGANPDSSVILGCNQGGRTEENGSETAS